MRATDQSRASGLANQMKADLEQLKRGLDELRLREGGGAVGTAMVIDAVAVGGGCLCTIEALSNGGYAGMPAEARCHGAVLAAGAVALYVRHADGTIELFAGGGGAGATTEIINAGAIIPVGMFYMVDAGPSA
jgi:hypothetical protein